MSIKKPTRVVGFRFHAGQLGESLFPVSQYVSFYGAQPGYFAGGEIAFTGDDRWFVVIAGFQSGCTKGQALSRNRRGALWLMTRVLPRRRVYK